VDNLMGQYNTEPVKQNSQSMVIFKWFAFVLLYIIAILALIFASLAYTKISLSSAQQKTLTQLTDNVSFNGSVLVASGFSDGIPNSNATQNFVVGGGNMLIDTIKATGPIEALSLVADAGLTVRNGPISAPSSGITSSSLNTALVQLTKTTKNTTMTPSLLTIGDSASLATMNMQASSISFANVNGRTTTLTANGISVPNQNLIGLRYVANGMLTSVTSTTSYQMIAPATATNTYGGLFIGPSELSLPATFEIDFSGSYTNTSGSTVTCKIALVNGSVYDDTQAFLGGTTSIVSPPLPSNGTSAFTGKYTVTFLLFGLNVATSFTSGSISYGVAPPGSAVTSTLNSTSSTINASLGLNLSLWVVFSTTVGTVAITLQELSVKQLISIPVG